MSNIRRQSIISSVVIYIGFAVGLLNTYFWKNEFAHVTQFVCWIAGEGYRRKGLNDLDIAFILALGAGSVGWQFLDDHKSIVGLTMLKMAKRF